MPDDTRMYSFVAISSTVAAMGNGVVLNPGGRPGTGRIPVSLLF